MVLRSEPVLGLPGVEGRWSEFSRDGLGTTMGRRRLWAAVVKK
jgi:hypothetical protein